MSHRFATAQIARAAGAELRRLRLAAGLSQGQVACFVDSHRPIIARIECGWHVPTLETCELFTAVCGGSLLDVSRVIDRALGLSHRRVSARRAALENTA